MFQSPKHFEMALQKDDVGEVANLLEKAKVAQVNLLTFKGRSLKLNTAQDGKSLFSFLKSS